MPCSLPARKRIRRRTAAETSSAHSGANSDGQRNKSHPGVSGSRANPNAFATESTDTMACPCVGTRVGNRDGWLAVVKMFVVVSVLVAAVVFLYLFGPIN